MTLHPSHKNYTQFCVTRNTIVKYLTGLGLIVSIKLLTLIESALIKMYETGG